jgi:hypothetical protein
MFRRTFSLASPHKNNNQIKIAILGSGISGCTAASILLEQSSTHNLAVTIYESGRGIGGRMSTRRIMVDKQQAGGGTHDDKICYQFDHGCQYISSPTKTNEFQIELNKWINQGWVKPWQGTFGTIRPDDNNSHPDHQLSMTIQLDSKQGNSEKYVGYPSMNSICENLLKVQSQEHSTINVVTGKQVRAVSNLNQQPNQVSSPRPWQIYHDNQSLGDYDWIIVTDRNSAQESRSDLENAQVVEFRHHVQKNITSIKSCTTMIVFEKPLPLPFDGLAFDYYNKNNNQASSMMREQFGTLGWIARDSSKPGRQQSSNHDGECWVIQSNVEEATRLLASKELEGDTTSLEKIRSVIRERMVNDFIKSIPILMKINDTTDTSNTTSSSLDQEIIQIPRILESVGHRWGAAFPQFIEGDGSEENMYKQMECQILPEKQFVACGDYFSKYPGRVEGGYLSGRAAAIKLLECIQT